MAQLRAVTTASGDDHTTLKQVDVIDKRLMSYVVRLGVAGGIAGLAAKTLIAPFDRIKILFQTLNPDFVQYRGSLKGFFQAARAIWRTDGVTGLFQGHLVTLLRIFPYAAIKFVAYEQIRALLIPSDQYETAVRRFMAGSLLGLALVCCTYPLDLIRVRMAFDTRHFVHTRQHGRLRYTVLLIYNELPPLRPSDPKWVRFMRRVMPHHVLHILNFYRGFYPTILGMIPYAGVSFYTHDAIHDVFRLPWFREWTVQQPSQLLKNRRDKATKAGKVQSTRDLRAPLTAPAQLIAGGLAGMCSQTLAYPFEVIRRRMQVGGIMNKGEFLLFKDTTKLIWKELGIRGFFVGLLIGYMKVIPMVLCLFFVYERTKAWLLK